MSEELLTTIKVTVDASGVASGVDGAKRSLKDLGKEVATISDKASKDIAAIGKDGAIDSGISKATKAVIRDTAKLDAEIQKFGTAAFTGFGGISKSAEQAYIAMAGKGISDTYINAYIDKLKEAQGVQKYVAQEAAKTAAQAAQAIEVENQRLSHTLELKRQIASVTTAQSNSAAAAQAEIEAQQKMKLLSLNNQIQASNKATADAYAKSAAQEVASTKSKADALKAYVTEARNAELNLIHTGRGKSSAMLTDKGRDLGFSDAEISRVLAGNKKIEASMAAAFAAANPHIAQLEKNAAAAGTSAKALSASLRNVPAQFTDIIVSLQGGQAPLTVLLQQGGQLKDMFGGIGNAGRALGGYVMGLINPFTLAAAAAGTLALSYLKGASEGEAYNKALILTGNSAGTTAAQLSQMAQAVAQSTGGTVGAAADALAQLAGNGNIASAQFEKIASTAVMMEKATGAAVADTVKQFAELGKDPLQASLRLNESTKFLTLSVYEQIKALTDQGRTLEAGVVAQNAYADVMKTRAPALIENLGYAEAAWKGVMGAAKLAWDSMLNAGRASDPTQQIVSALDGAKSKLAQLELLGQGKDNQIAIAAAEKQIRQLEQKATLNSGEIRTKEILAELEAEGSKQAEKQAAFDKLTESSLSKQVKMRREIAQAGSALEALGAGASDPKNIDAYAQKIKAIQEANKESAAPKVSNAGESEIAGIRARVIETQKYIDALKIGGIEGAKQNEGEKLSIKIKEELRTSISGVARANKVASLAEAEKLAALLKVSAAEEGHQKAIKKSADEYQNLIDATYKGADSIAEQAARQEAANAVFGKGKAAIEAMTLAELNHQMAEAQGSDRFSDQYIAGLQAKIDAQTRYAKSLAAADYKTVNAHTQELLRSAQEMDGLYKSEAEYAYTTGVEREKIIALREVEIKYAKELAKIEASNMSDDEKAAQRQVVNQAKQIEGSAAVSKVMQSDWAKTVEKYDDIFRTGFADMLNNGKGAWESFSKSLVTTFKTSVADQLYKMFAQPFVMRVVASLIGVTGSATASAASAAGSASNGLIGAANTASGLSNLASIGGAGFQLATGSLAGASSASLIGANAVGAVGGDAMGALIAGNGGWAGVSTAATAGEVGALGTAAGAGSGAGAGIMSSIGAAAPYVLAALAVYSMLKGNGGTPTASTGDASVNFDAAGSITRRAASSDYFYGGSMTQAADDFAVNLNKSYLGAAKALGIKAQETIFNYSGNTGKNGESPNFGISGGVIGSAGFNSGEVGYSADAMSLAASRAVFDALQSSELPKYLQGAFDGLTASSMDAKAIADTMASATALKQFHDQLQALPFAALKDLSYTATASLIAFSGGLDKFGANLGTYYDKFYSVEEKTALLTKNTGAAFADLGLVMPAVNDGLRTNYRAMIEGLAAQDLSVAANARAYAGALSLASAVDQLAPALVDAAKAATDAATAAMGVTSKLASDAISGLTKSVAAEKSKLSAIYDTQLTSYTAHLDTVTASVGKLQHFASSLSSTLDGMRISGSDSTYRLSAQAQISSALATARAGGSLPLDGQLSSALATISKPSEALFATFEDYARDFYKTANDISALNDLTGSALTAEQTSQSLLQEQISTLKTGFDAETTRLDALVTSAQAQLDAANGISTGVLTLTDAISALTLAMQSMTGAIIAGLSAGSIKAPAALAQIKAATGSALAPDAWSTVKTATGDAQVWASSGGAAALNTATGQQIYGKDGSQFSATDAIASVTANLAASNAAQVYADATRTGISAASLDALMGWGAGTSNAWAVSNALPKFSAGINYVPHDMQAIIHEGEAVVPKVYNPFNPNAAQTTRSMLQSGGANNAEVVAELRAMADRLDRIEANTRATAGHTAGTDRKLARVIPGNAVITQVATA
jgi:hypothetical protein